MSDAGSAPDRRISDSSATSSCVNDPVMRASVCMIADSIRGAERTLPSSTIASVRPTLADVTLPNFLEPSDLSVKPTAGRPNSSTTERAFRRSLPVTAGTDRTRYHSVIGLLRSPPIPDITSWPGGT